MITVEPIDTSIKSHVRRFVRIPYRLYANHPQWVPPPMADVETQLNRQKHPFYEHSDADFFVVNRDGRDVGRIAVMENRRYNEYHGTRQAQFYLFECEDDLEAARALFERAFEWARARGLDTIVGPKGFAALDGYGIQVEGFEHRQMMTMMNYNYPYYPRLVEALGFRKVVDFVSCYIDPTTYQLPERVRRIAERVKQRGELQVYRFKDKRDLIRWAPRIGQAYNKSFINNWEYYPLTEREIDFVVQNILVIADPRLMKIIIHKDEVVGFLFIFPDISAALQRAKGHLYPWNIADLLLELRRTEWVSLNGVGILPEFQGRGGNALMYAEIADSVNQFHFKHAEETQMAETAVDVRSDMVTLGARPYKNHRVYGREV